MMELGGFIVDLKQLVEACKKHKSKHVAVQIPAALLHHSAELAAEIEKKCKVKVFMGARPTYGACDLMDTNALKTMDIDLLVNFGHAELPSIKNYYEREYDIPLIFIELPSNQSELKLDPKDARKLGGSVALVTTVQYAHLLPQLEAFLEEQGLKTYISTGDGRIKHPGQVLGCNYSTMMNIPREDVDTYLYMGTGRFHPLGIALSVDKPLYALDPHLGIIFNFEMRKERYLRKRYAMITKAQEGKKFAVVISTKPGQRRVGLGLEIMKKLKKKKKQGILYIVDEVDPQDFDYTDVDIIVSTACPRIALDDSDRYKKPIITPVELEIALNDRKWEDYYPDMILD